MESVVYCLNFKTENRHGLYDIELQWFTDNLFLRKQIFQFNGVLSEPKPVYTGVPQGSILRPLLFVIIFNGVHSRLSHCKIITYANDTVIFTSSSDIDAIQGNLSQDLDNLFRNNEVNLKEVKTEVMLFGTSKRLNLFQCRQQSGISLNLRTGPLRRACFYQKTSQNIAPVIKNFQRTELNMSPTELNMSLRYSSRFHI